MPDFTIVTISEVYESAPGVPSTGYVVFTPSTALINNSNWHVFAKTPYKSRLVSGVLTAPLIALNDSTTIPTGQTWTAVEVIDGVTYPPFSFSLSTTQAPTVALHSLTPAVPVTPALASYALQSALATEVARATASETAITSLLSALSAVPWAASTAYPVKQMVTNGGILWEAPAPVPSRSVFTSSDWTELASITTPIGTTTGTVAAGDDSRIVGAMSKAGGQFTGIFDFNHSNTPNEYWVSKGTLASDSNSGQRDAPFSTLAHAVSVAETASVPYRINLGYGTHNLSAADGNGNGATVTQIGAAIRGLGENLSTINIGVTGLKWGVLLADKGKLTDVSITYTNSITIPYWTTGTTCGSGAHSHGCEFKNIYVLTQGGLTVPTIPGGTSTQPSSFFALGPDNPGSTSMDIANNTFNRCYVVGFAGANAGFLIGNGNNRNATQNRSDECEVTGCEYGIVLSGGGHCWMGGGFSGNITADIYVTLSAGEEIKFVGTRGENGNLFLKTSAAFGELNVILDGCFAGNYTPTSGSVAGQIIQFNAPGQLIMIGGSYYTTGTNTSVGLNTASAAMTPTIIAHGVTFDTANPFPTASAFCRRIIFGTKIYNTGTAAHTLNPDFQGVVDGLAVPILGGCAAVAIANITLSGTQTIDGYPAVVGDRVLATAQTTASQNGPWLVATGAWTRPADFFTGATHHGRQTFVMNGTVYKNTTWILDSPTAGIVVDTSSQTWGQSRPTPLAYGSNFLSASVALTTSAVTAIKDTDTLQPGVYRIKVHAQLQANTTGGNVDVSIGVGTATATFLPSAAPYIAGTVNVPTSAIPTPFQNEAIAIVTAAGTLRLWAFPAAGCVGMIAANLSVVLAQSTATHIDWEQIA